MFSLIPIRRKSMLPGVWGPGEGLWNRFESLFDDLPMMGPGEKGFMPKLDVSETEGEVVVRLEAPGMEAKDFEVSLEKGKLYLSGEKKEVREDEKEDYHVRETHYGSFCRTVDMPAEVDTDNVNAEYVGGVLKVTMKKTEEAKRMRKRIEIH